MILLVILNNQYNKRTHRVSHKLLLRQLIKELEEEQWDGTTSQAMPKFYQVVGT